MDVALTESEEKPELSAPRLQTAHAGLSLTPRDLTASISPQGQRPLFVVDYVVLFVTSW